MKHPGLTAKQVEESRQQHGANTLTQIPPDPLWKKILEGFKDPMIMILLVALVVQVVLFFLGQSEWFEPVGILVAILIANGVASISENKQEGKASALKEEEEAKEMAKVLRDGKLQEIHVSEVVVGDIVYLQAGDKIPADGIVIEGAIKVDQAALNGETEEADKITLPADTDYDIKDLLNKYYAYRGTVVCGGEAYMEIKVVGDKTLFGELALEVQEDTRETPLQVKLGKLAKQISTFGYVGAIAIVIGVMSKTLLTGNMPNGVFEWIRLIMDAITIAVTIIVCAVPEGLPMLTSILLSFQSLKMAKDNVLVRKINGLETAGSLSILFSDKTGTITEGRLSVVEMATGNVRVFDSLAKMTPALAADVVTGIGVNNSAVASNGQIIGGNSTDRALMAFLVDAKADNGMSKEDVRNFNAFDSAKKYSSVTLVHDGKSVTYIKGAPEKIIEKCSHYIDENGNVKELVEKNYHMPPHVKYILLEKSEDLVFDIIDHRTELLDRRQYRFSQNGWSKLTEVPPEENMPAVFVIIDEFAQMSQILKETKGAGYGLDYTIKLENLLAKGRALGLKFIFASQTYTTGISGLTETACKQIQMRFALKNTPDEIKQTLNLSSDQITPELSRTIASMPAYQTIFKWADEDNNVHIGQYRNMYTVGNEVEALVDQINAVIKPIRVGRTTDTTFIDKKPVLIDGSQPKTFKSQVPYYKEYEAAQDLDDLDDSDILVYAGVPCSFSLAKPFTLCNATAENILIAGGDRDSKVNVILSILNSYSRKGHDIEIWAHERSPIFKRYKNTVFGKRTQRTDLGEICSQISDIKKAIQKRTVSEKLIICFGYENLASDFDILGDGATEPVIQERPHSQRDSSLPDMSEILQRVRECDDPEEKKRIVEEYNRRRSEVETDSVQGTSEDEESNSIYDARNDVEWIIKRASNYGLHFLFCFDQGRDFINLRLDENAFRHKILFPMSKDESISIMGSRKANEIGDGTCIYSNGKDAFTLRPHIYRGVPCNGWTIDDNGNIVQRG